MTWLDVVIDPLTVHGERWFLGRIYYYPEGGIYFGVPLSNFVGWFVVGVTTIRLYQRWDRCMRPARGRRGRARHVRYAALLEPLIYLGILVFNLAPDVLDRRAAARHGRGRDVRPDRGALRACTSSTAAGVPRPRTSRRTRATTPRTRMMRRCRDGARAPFRLRPCQGTSASLVVTAVRAETRAVLGAVSRVTRSTEAGPGRRWEGRVGERSVTIIEAGIGPVRAAAALRAAIAATDLVVSRSVLRARSSVTALREISSFRRRSSGSARRISTATTVASGLLDTAERALRDRRSCDELRRGALFSSPTVIATPAAKRATAARTGAVAVEMEAAGDHRGRAASAACPCSPLRVILDTADVSLEHLPPDLDSSWRARARLVARPAAWPGVLTLARHVPGAARALGRALGAVLPALAR